MARWFRFYDEALNDPKVQRLDGETFKAWINLLCLASQNGGKLPTETDIAFALRIDLNAAVTVVERLLNGGLIDRLNGGANGYHYAPHGWTQRQYKSDTSSERVKRYRERSKTVTETPPDTDTDTDVTVAKATDAGASPDKVFWDAAVSFVGTGKRSLIGKWCKDYGKTETAQAITAAQLERPADRVSYIEGVLRKGRVAAKAEPVVGI